DPLVAAGRAVQTWHLGRGPGIVVEVEPGKPAILAFAEGRDCHPPTGRQRLPVKGLAWKERETIVQRHVTSSSPTSRRRRTGRDRTPGSCGTLRRSPRRDAARRRSEE